MKSRWLVVIAVASVGLPLWAAEVPADPAKKPHPCHSQTPQDKLGDLLQAERDYIANKPRAYPHPFWTGPEKKTLGCCRDQNRCGNGFTADCTPLPTHIKEWIEDFCTDRHWRLAAVIESEYKKKIADPLDALGGSAVDEPFVKPPKGPFASFVSRWRFEAADPHQYVRRDQTELNQHGIVEFFINAHNAVDGKLVARLRTAMEQNGAELDSVKNAAARAAARLDPVLNARCASHAGKYETPKACVDALVTLAAPADPEEVKRRNDQAAAQAQEAESARNDALAREVRERATRQAETRNQKCPGWCAGYRHNCEGTSWGRNKQSSNACSAFMSDAKGQIVEGTLSISALCLSHCAEFH